MDHEHCLESEPDPTVATWNCDFNAISIVGTENSGKHKLASMFQRCGTRPYLGEAIPGFSPPYFSPPREFIFDRLKLPTRKPFLEAMQMLALKITGSYFPQEIVDRVVDFLLEFHPCLGMKIMHCGIRNKPEETLPPLDTGVRLIEPSFLSSAGIIILCYNWYDRESFLELKRLWESSNKWRPSSHQWVFVVGTHRGEDVLPVIDRDEALRLAPSVPHQSSVRLGAPDDLAFNHFRCNIDSLEEVDDLFEKIVYKVGWLKWIRETLNQEEREAEETELMELRRQMQTEDAENWSKMRKRDQERELRLKHRFRYKLKRRISWFLGS